MAWWGSIGLLALEETEEQLIANEIVAKPAAFGFGQGIEGVLEAFGGKVQIIDQLTQEQCLIGYARNCKGYKGAVTTQTDPL